jgi:hypothetical protein
MKTAPLPLIALLAAASLFAAVARADSTIDINSDSFAAIAYSPATGKYGYGYNYRNRSAAEKAALDNCGTEDARIACWVNRGFCALALGDDKTCWGVGWQYGGGSSNNDAKKSALENCGKRTTGAHIAVCLSSDGQYIWEPSKSAIVIRPNGEVILPSGDVLRPNGEIVRPSGEVIPPPAKDGASVSKTPDGQNKK